MNKLSIPLAQYLSISFACDISSLICLYLAAFLAVKPFLVHNAISLGVNSVQLLASDGVKPASLHDFAHSRLPTLEPAMPIHFDASTSLKADVRQRCAIDGITDNLFQASASAKLKPVLFHSLATAGLSIPAFFQSRASIGLKPAFFHSPASAARKPLLCHCS